jgi:probable F420-dependent oxidoreductase
MLRLAAERADGAHPYNTTPQHTAQARKLLAAGPLLCPEQAVILEANATKARAIARKFLAVYLTLPNYTNNFLRLGFSETDFANGGSDRLIDAVIAWGDLKPCSAALKNTQKTPSKMARTDAPCARG